MEWDPVLAESARTAAPPGIEVHCGDAGTSDAYAGAVPADLILACGVFGNISQEDVRTTIAAWRFLGAPGATAIWTRGSSDTPNDPRERVRQWVTQAGFEELSFDGSPERFGVGVARMLGDPEPFQSGATLFRFR